MLLFQITGLQAGAGTPTAAPASTVTHVPAQTPVQTPQPMAPSTTVTAGADVNAEIARLNAQMQHFANNDQYIKAMEISQTVTICSHCTFGLALGGVL